MQNERVALHVINDSEKPDEDGGTQNKMCASDNGRDFQIPFHDGFTMSVAAICQATSLSYLRRQFPDEKGYASAALRQTDGDCVWVKLLPNALLNRQL